MIIKSMQFLRTPFDSSYSDVIDVLDCSNKTEAQIETDIYNFLVSNYTIWNFTIVGDARAENETDFSMKVVFTFTYASQSNFSSLRDFNYAIITDKSDKKHFFFINSFTQKNNITVLNSTTQMTYIADLTLDIWTTYYPKIASNSYINKNAKIEKMHQKLGSLVNKVITINKDFILPDIPNDINTNFSLSANIKDHILWLKVKLKVPTSEMVPFYRTSEDIDGGVWNLDVDMKDAMLPLTDSVLIYYPTLVFDQTDIYEIKEYNKFAKFYFQDSTSDGLKYFELSNGNDFFNETKLYNDYIETVELTFLSPFDVLAYDINIGSHRANIYFKMSNSENQVFGLYRPAKIHIGGSGSSSILPQGMVIVTDNVFNDVQPEITRSITNYSNTINLTDKYEYAVLTHFTDEQINEDDCFDFSVLLTQHPYKKKGIIFDGKYYPYVKKYVGNNTDLCSIVVKDACDGHYIAFGITNNGKQLSKIKDNVEFLTSSNYMPFSSSQYDSYMIANSNRMKEDLRHNEEMYALELASSAADSVGAIAGGNPISIGANIGQSLINALRARENYKHFKNSIKALKRDLQNMPSVRNTSGVGGFINSYQYGKIIFMEYNVIKDDWSIAVAVDEWCMGTDCGIVGNPFSNTRLNYDYVLTSDFSIKCKDINKIALSKFSQILNNGVRKWHCNNYNGNSHKQLNPFIFNFDADWYS